MDGARSTAGWIVAGLALVVSGCDRDDKADAAPTAPSASAASRPSSDQQQHIQIGDEVVVEGEAATYWAGTVVKLDGTKISYEYGTNRSKGDAERDKVYVVAEDHRTVASADDLAVCRTGPASWNPCVVKRVDGNSYVVGDLFGKEHDLTERDVIVPSDEARERIKEKLDKAFKHLSFVEAARAAGAPRRPEGWTPRPGDEIVAQLTDASWYGGRIRRLTPTKVHIAWDDKSPASERSHDEVVPRPDGEQAVRAGQYVLGRPQRGSRWDYFLVESVDERGVVLVDQEGRKRKAKKNHVIPLGT